MRITIVDDDSASRAVVLGHLEQYRTARGHEFDVVSFDHPDDFLDAYRGDSDILLLDVEMPAMDGFEVGDRVRELDQRVPIIYVTNRVQDAIRGYRVNALDYVVKPVRYVLLERALDKAFDAVAADRGHTLVLQQGGEFHRIAVRDILYVDALRHRITVHGTQREWTVTGTLKSFEEELADKGFFRSNNCYLVNLDHVLGADAQSCTLSDGTALAVSRPRRAGFMAALAARLAIRPAAGR